jgi:hypothetical protein
MLQILETVIILLVVALATAWLAKRFLLKGKRGCGDTASCKCPKPTLPTHIKKVDPS